MDFWKDKRVLVTGGAGFIGSHLVEELIKRESKVLVLDNFYSGNVKNIIHLSKEVGLIIVDLLSLSTLMSYFKGAEIVIHLAAVIGGRGFIEENPAECCYNLPLNHNVILTSYLAGVNRIHYSSTACVYPKSLQDKYSSEYLLKEEDAIGNCDDTYGWAKYMGELELQAFKDQYNLKSSISRYVTVYGPRENETHSIISLLKKAILKEDPFIVWGTGEQDRDFTFVSDIVDGTLLLSELITDGTPINLGTSNRIKINDLVKKILNITSHDPKEIVFDVSKPEGVKSRALDISKAKALGWSPKVSLDEGLERTYLWMKSRLEGKI